MPAKQSLVNEPKLDRDLLSIVHGDLLVLAKDWNQDIDDNSLRVASPILYRLLIENALPIAARMLGSKALRIMAPLISKETDFNKLPGLVFWQAGGARFRGMEVMSVAMYDRALSEPEMKANYEREKVLMGKQYPEKLSVYLNQTAFVIRSVKIDRAEVIKYVNNKIGGRHYDTTRKDSELEQKYSLLDEIRKQLIVADKNAVYYELLSIGQRIVNSRDVMKLRRAIEKVLRFC